MTVWTIADRAFLPGVAGLINSLRSGGFEGAIVVGSPDELPELTALHGVQVRHIRDEPLWLGFVKPSLLLRHAEGPFAFFDADIVVDGATAMEALRGAVRRGPLLALEALVGPTDIRRARWSDRIGGRPRSDAWAYFNGGFIAGDMPRDRPLLEAWSAAMTSALGEVRGYFSDPDFPLGDQDVLNAVVQTDREFGIVSLQMPDWWSAVSPLNPFFHVGAFARALFHHSTGPKPWKLTEVPPRGPNEYERLWYRHVVERPAPLAVSLDIPPNVQRWLSASVGGRLLARGSRLSRRVGLR